MKASLRVQQLKNPCGSVARVEGEVCLVLAARKKACRDVVGVADHTDGFDVDSDLASG